MEPPLPFHKSLIVLFYHLDMKKALHAESFDVYLCEHEELWIIDYMDLISRSF